MSSSLLVLVFVLALGLVLVVVLGLVLVLGFISSYAIIIVSVCGPNKEQTLP